MSDTFTIPPFAVDYDIRWISVDLDGDIAVWARKSAQDVLARWGAKGGRREKDLAKFLEEAGTIVRRMPDVASGAFLLYPGVGEKIRAMVRLMPVDMHGHDQNSGWSAMLAWLLPPKNTGIDPEITDIGTRAGLCKRIRFRLTDNRGSVEQLAYTWVYPQYGAAVIMSCTFTDLEEADQWRPAVDELAAAAELDEAAG
jgi:hypothetical protein